MAFRQFSLGTVAPRIEAVRVHHNRAENVVELDLDLKWAGNAQVTLFAQTLVGTEMVVQVAGLQLSGVLKVQLGPLRSDWNPFLGLALTFAKRPYIDFSLLFSEADDGADVLNAGAFASQHAGLGLSSAIQHVVRTALETAVVYPRWYRIPWYEGGESSLEVNQLPVGVLAVTIKACTNLKVGNMTRTFVLFALLTQSLLASCHVAFRLALSCCHPNLTP